MSGLGLHTDRALRHNGRGTVADRRVTLAWRLGFLWDFGALSRHFTSGVCFLSASHPSLLCSCPGRHSTISLSSSLSTHAQRRNRCEHRPGRDGARQGPPELLCVLSLEKKKTRTSWFRSGSSCQLACRPHIFYPTRSFVLVMLLNNAVRLFQGTSARVAGVRQSFPYLFLLLFINIIFVLAAS